MVFLKRCVLLLTLLTVLAMPLTASAMAMPKLASGRGLTAAAFGEYYLVHDPNDPFRLTMLDAATGQIAGLLLLGADSGASEELRIRVSEHCAILMTPRYAYRIGNSLRVEKRVPVPELPGQYEINADLSTLIYQDDLSILEMNRATGKTTLLLEGDYEAFPQRIYSEPSYLSDEQHLLISSSTGSDYPVPAVLDLDSGELVELHLSFDIDTSCRRFGDRLLVFEAFAEVPAETAPEEAAEEDGSYSEEPEETVLEPFTGYVELLDGTLHPLPIPVTGYGCQAACLSQSFAQYFADDKGVWRLCHVSLNGTETIVSDISSDAGNLQILAATPGGHILYRSFDLQEPALDRVYLF